MKKIPIIYPYVRLVSKKLWVNLLSFFRNKFTKRGSLAGQSEAKVEGKLSLAAEHQFPFGKAETEITTTEGKFTIKKRPSSTTFKEDGGNTMYVYPIISHDTSIKVPFGKAETEIETTKNFSTLARMVFDPPLDINKIIVEGNANKFTTEDEWHWFILKKTWEAAI